MQGYKGKYEALAAEKYFTRLVFATEKKAFVKKR